MLERKSTGLAVHMRQYQPVISAVFYKTDDTDACITHYKDKGNVIPLQAQCGPEGG